MSAEVSLLSVLRERRSLALLALGFASGLPLALTSGSLQAWLTTAGIDIKTIGWFTLIQLPYTLKFLWSPLIDRYALPLAGRRRGWMALTQLLLGAGLAGMALLAPTEHAAALAAVALLVAFVSATQDIAFDAYRTEVLPPEQRGLGAALSVTGYRIAMLVSGAVALVLADRIGWPNTYLVMALLMASAVLVTLLAPAETPAEDAPRTLGAAIVEPFLAFFSRPGAWVLVALIVLYKLGDAAAGTLSTSFLLRGVGFTQTEVGVVNKGVGLAATLGGMALGGALMLRWRLPRALLVFGLLQALTNFGFLMLALAGPSWLGLVSVVVLENLAGGMGTVAFVALVMALCDVRYTATQFALLSALAAVNRVFIGPVAGYVVDAHGWAPFYLLTVLLALPGLWLVWRLRARLAALDPPPPATQGSRTTLKPTLS